MNITQKTKARGKSHTSSHSVTSSPCSQTLYNTIIRAVTCAPPRSHFPIEREGVYNHILIRDAKHTCCGFPQLFRATYHHSFSNLTWKRKSLSTCFYKSLSTCFYIPRFSKQYITYWHLFEQTIFKIHVTNQQKLSYQIKGQTRLTWC